MLKFVIVVIEAKFNGKISSMNKIIDLFAGVGGLSLGFAQAGFDVVAAYDVWEKARRVYDMNFRHPFYIFDLADEKLAARHICQHSPHIIIGGPPCQDFSSAGKREERKNADLTQSFARIVSIIRPMLFVMENVARVSGSASYAHARKVFKESDYGLTEIVLDASYCGVPQKRRRFFCIGAQSMRDGAFLPSLADMCASEPLTVASYMQNEIDTEFYYRHPRNYSRRAIYSIDEPSATIRGVNRPIPPNYPGHPGDAAPIDKARPLTTAERSRIQTFPASWKWCGSKTDVEQMIGNAVPVNLGGFVASGIARVCQ